jgi:ABC-2 type transport system permease protein
MKIRDSKIWTIIKHEYKSKIKSKGFIISTLLGPIILIGFLAVTVFVSVLTSEDTNRKLSVLDLTELGIDRKLIERDSEIFEIPKAKSETELQQMILEDKIDGYVILQKDFLKTAEATMYSRGGGGWGIVEKVERNLTNILRKERLIANGTDTNIIKMIDLSASVKTKKITEKGTEKDYTEAFAGIGYILGFFIYMMMLMYGQYVSRGVIEEKANRIIEVIASSVRPIEIMLGKVFGIGLLGLTQVFFWISMSLLLLWAAGPIISMFQPDPETIKQGLTMASQQNPIPFEIPKIPVSLVVAFVYFFLVGYFMYSTIFAAIGSAVDQESDAAQLQSPIVFIVVTPMLFMPAVTSNPDSTLATILSLIPFFSPILMTVRIAATNVPLWEIAASVVLTSGTVIGLIWIAAKIYRVGILMYGKKPKLKDLIKWVRLAK